MRRPPGCPTHSFDAVVSNMGTIFVEPTAQVAELERLLKAGGTLAFSSWAPNKANPLHSHRRGPRSTSGLALHPRPMGDPETITARLSDGFVDVSIENGMHTWEFASVDSAVNFVTNESPKHVSCSARSIPQRASNCGRRSRRPWQRTVTTLVCASTHRMSWSLLAGADRERPLTLRSSGHADVGT